MAALGLAALDTAALSQRKALLRAGAALLLRGGHALSGAQHQRRALRHGKEHPPLRGQRDPAGQGLCGQVGPAGQAGGHPAGGDHLPDGAGPLQRVAGQGGAARRGHLRGLRQLRLVREREQDFRRHSDFLRAQVLPLRGPPAFLPGGRGRDCGDGPGLRQERGGAERERGPAAL